MKKNGKTEVSTMRKRTLSIILIICLLFSMNPAYVFATEDVEGGAYVVGNNVTVNKLLEQSKFTAKQGHGFAAEVGNNLIDKAKGNNAVIVGNDNVKNGPDRLIIGRDGSRTWIQDKYYNTAKKSVNACFENNQFRYVDADGNAMQIEVASDQYDEAVLLMKEKIQKGYLKNAGVTDPEEAYKIVKKGSLKYNQAVNLAKGGTVESLVFDAANGVVSATSAFGISTVVVYTVATLNGYSPDEAMDVAIDEGLKTGSVVFGTSVIAGQLTKSNAKNLFKPTSEALVKAYGDDFAKAILKSVGEEITGLSDDAVRTKAAEILRKQWLVTGITIALLTAEDVKDIVQGRISSEQLIKNLAVLTAGVAGGYAGAVVGGTISSAILPGAGTTAGSVAGSIVGGAAAGYGAEKLLGLIIKEDADQMLEIIEVEFYKLADDYILSESEANNVMVALKIELEGDKLKDMFASEDREAFAVELIEPLVKKEIAKRSEIIIPTAEEMRDELKTTLKGVVYIH